MRTDDPNQFLAEPVVKVPLLVEDRQESTEALSAQLRLTTGFTGSERFFPTKRVGIPLCISRHLASRRNRRLGASGVQPKACMKHSTVYTRKGYLPCGAKRRLTPARE